MISYLARTITYGRQNQVHQLFNQEKRFCSYLSFSAMVAGQQITKETTQDHYQQVIHYPGCQQILCLRIY